MDADDTARLRAAAERLRTNWYDAYGCTGEGLTTDCREDIRFLARGVLSLLDRLAAAEADRERLRSALAKHAG